MTSHAQTNEPDDSVDQAGDQPHSPQTREAQQAHGGSMAPGLVDPTGRPLRKPPQDEIIEEESGGHR